MNKARKGMRLHSCRWEVTRAQICFPVLVERKIFCFLACFPFTVGLFQTCSSYRVSIIVKVCKLKCNLLICLLLKSTAKQLFSLLYVEQALFGT